MRARNIKPGFFKNDTLAECDPICRLLFIGLWCAADREGRLEKRPLRIKAEIFPYDSLDINRELTVLERKGFVKTYVVDGSEYLQVVNFKEHQNPHHTEAKSKLPDISDGCVVTVNSPLNTGEYPADSLIHGFTDSLIPDSLIPDSRKNTLSDSSESNLTQVVVVDEMFESFWDAFGYKSGKEPAKKAWKKIKPNLQQASQIIEAAKEEARMRPHRISNGQTPKMAQGWLTAKRWQDEHLVAIPLNFIQQKKVQQHIESSEFSEAYNALPFG